MARVWFTVIVLISIQQAFGNTCLKNQKDFSCDECIRCGLNWCNKGKSPHCLSSRSDNECSDDLELLPTMDEVTTPGLAVNPIYAERTLHIREPNSVIIKYTSKNTIQKAKMTIVRSTQNFNIELKESEQKCNGMNCTTKIQATASNEFCNASGGLSEYVDVKIDLGIDEDVMVKYYVPCACECSQKVEQRSMSCHKNGDLTCGACTCYAGWTGEYCDKAVCDQKRGDVAQCSYNPRNEADCSGNGECSTCETCICYKDREGSQYFDAENNCAGLCTIASECDECLLNRTIGECDSCIHSMTIMPYNRSLTEERDELNRKVWVTCNETIADCRIDYVAMRDETGEIYVMVVSSCHDFEVAAVVGGQKVSIILGVLGIVAAVAAVGGVMLWKHLNTVPPVPLNDPQYQNIDAEDCTGENPLYKPPTSSFKNPTYGKW